MEMRTLAAAAAALALAACASPHAGHGSPQGAPGAGGMAARGMPDGPMMAMAMARLESTRGNTASGMAMFHQRGDMVMLHVRVQGLKPGQEHGFHIHDKGDCSSGDGMSTGGHFNPAGKPHARHDMPERHAGDLPSLKADAAGRVDVHLQRVIWQSEVVHADVDIARIGQRVEGARQHGHLGRTCRQLLCVNAALRLEAFGQVRIGIQRNPVRTQTFHLLQRPVKRLGGLKGQAVNQVDVDRFKNRSARRLDQCKHLVCRLDAVHGLLHRRVKVLHAKTQAVETQLGQHGQAVFIHGAWVHLDRVFTARCKLKVLTQKGHELSQLLVTHESGCAAAQMQLADRLTAP